MKALCSLTALLAISICVPNRATAQGPMPQPGPEHEILKKDVGTWDVEIKTWAGPGEPTVTKGKETNRMMGGFWLIANFEGNMMGVDFQGHGVYGYDAEKKTYVGQWFDSFGSPAMAMTGEWDKETRTMTYEGMAKGMDGKPAKHILASTYNDDGTRVLTMHIQSGQEMQKFFEMKYTKSE